ncbi:MAG: radical SAM protein [Anaerolineaceae bacterium]
MRILMIYPEFPDTFWSFKHALKFINRKINNPPLGLMTISALLPREWEKRLIDTNIEKLNDRDIEWADMVFISAMDVQRTSVNQIIQQVKHLHKPLIAGGPLFTGSYDDFPEVDTFILNEGEITLPLFLDDLQSQRPLQRVYATSEFADIQKTPLPDLTIINMDQYDTMSIQLSRGCPFHCDFCNVTAMLGHVPRLKTVEQILAELDQLYQAGWRHNVFFVDDNFIGNKKFIKEEILPALIQWHKDKPGFHYSTEASINLADDSELLDLMAEAGFVDVFIGIETPNEASLVECNKKQNSRRDLIQNIKVIQRHGIHVMAGFIVGFDEDPPDIFDQMISFIQESGIVTAMVGLLQAPAGTKLYSRLSDEGRILKEMSGDNADGTTNIKTKLPAAILREGYFRIMKSIYSPELLYPRIKTFLRQFQPVQRVVTIRKNEIFAFFKTLVVMGLNIKESRYYWNLIFWTLRHDAKKFPMAITLIIYGYHFRTITNRNMQMIAVS